MRLAPTLATSALSTSFPISSFMTSSTDTLPFLAGRPGRGGVANLLKSYTMTVPESVTAQTLTPPSPASPLTKSKPIPLPGLPSAPRAKVESKGVTQVEKRGGPGLDFLNDDEGAYTSQDRYVDASASPSGPPSSPSSDAYAPTTSNLSPALAAATTRGGGGGRERQSSSSMLAPALPDLALFLVAWWRAPCRSTTKVELRRCA
mmetsp:Transcript_7030/g.13716  ORF Transcript_7030/g.13716 Transcript_7030/m.13716 type:complete len:204 (-) Transcript_7030:541-1152(-)